MEAESKLKRYFIKTTESEYPREKVNSALDAFKFIKKFYSDDIEIYESFFILLVDRGSHTLGYAKISQGGVVGTVVDIKIIAKYLVDTLAAGIIVAHNHPSGNLVPSRNDNEITEKIKKMCGYFDSALVDHIILTKHDYYSYADNGLI